jgi:hypothetical protein
MISRAFSILFTVAILSGCSAAPTVPEMTIVPPEWWLEAQAQCREGEGGENFVGPIDFNQLPRDFLESGLVGGTNDMLQLFGINVRSAFFRGDKETIRYCALSNITADHDCDSFIKERSSFKKINSAWTIDAPGRLERLCLTHR